MKKFNVMLDEAQKLKAIEILEEKLEYYRETLEIRNIPLDNEDPYEEMVYNSVMSEIYQIKVLIDDLNDAGEVKVK